ncbi:hypothetical protein AY522_07210 [Corynebacterium diphtheriae bv. gravis]|uniref:Transposase n=1 Tax=Corynebacterium diphtheriae bv. mitis TaxID=1806053 RepID=A0A854NPE2_CORDP|nr:hypothetical protein AY602_00310 [Corynebacterium diphtheriae bv. mitis]OWM92405.1 hypothetical protein AY480_03200 [Corynebacterium diphtheriae bv. gravis]OWM94879.1 hypothetical protein AY492_08750 [Corynebacterium diphtheriae bv. gravis]OWN02328.1 hypothetical protein AY497_04255 [Corynebacterium diphtheriae bv. gravis]OWN13259.1 hypothetical protein AY494_05665 [Corynebacterium diphtheriae bv. gravis]
MGWIFIWVKRVMQHRYRENSVGQALKKATSVAEQIQLLRHRGMNVNETLAVQWLANVSYYRLSGGCQSVCVRGLIYKHAANLTTVLDVTDHQPQRLHSR